MGQKIILATLAAAALAVACSQGSSPTAPKIDVPATTRSAESATLTASAFDYFLRSKVQWAFDGAALAASIPNPPYDVEPKILLQVNDRGVSPQVMLGFTASKHVVRGEPISWTVTDLPCGKLIEGELYVSDEPVPNDKISGGYLVAFFYGETPACPRPRPTPTTSPDPQCEGECCPTDEEPNPCPSPSPTPTPSPSPTPCPEYDVATFEPNPCPTPTPSPTPSPEPETCYYNISGQPHLRPILCALAGDGLGGTVGNWNFQENHCAVPFPGVSDDKFQLTPGQSATGCLRKQDD